jgi:hypothetical protein
MSLHEGMMTTTGRYADREIGAFRFIIGYYGRLLLIVLFRKNLVIIDQASAKSTEETK